MDWWCETGSAGPVTSSRGPRRPYLRRLHLKVCDSDRFGGLDCGGKVSRIITGKGITTGGRNHHGSKGSGERSAGRGGKVFTRISLSSVPTSQNATLYFDMGVRFQFRIRDYVLSIAAMDVEHSPSHRKSDSESGSHFSFSGTRWKIFHRHVHVQVQTFPAQCICTLPQRDTQGPILFSLRSDL